MDLDNVVERTIAINVKDSNFYFLTKNFLQEGREPPPDTNEEPPPPKEPEPSNYRPDTPSTSRPSSENCPLINRVQSLPKRPPSVKSIASYKYFPRLSKF